MRVQHNVWLQLSRVYPVDRFHSYTYQKCTHWHGQRNPAHNHSPINQNTQTIHQKTTLSGEMCKQVPAVYSSLWRKQHALPRVRDKEHSLPKCGGQNGTTVSQKLVHGVWTWNSWLVSNVGTTCHTTWHHNTDFVITFRTNPQKHLFSPLLFLFLHQHSICLGSAFYTRKHVNFHICAKNISWRDYKFLFWRKNCQNNNPLRKCSLEGMWMF